MHGGVGGAVVSTKTMPNKGWRKTHKSLLGRHLSQKKVYEVQDKILHCSALYGIIVLTKTNDNLPRRREPCSIPCEPSCAQAKLNYWNLWTSLKVLRSS